ncbi:hypothetical protein CROQUDRAFT_99656 [Cronartium quercuum f. sp. fusiforme G11]|uniref:Uncharacterized protein n=1 Tax=Cronartium quercuum f. sp. fusiforme G11 TaxID=708437 RepID=A0A9P6NAJ7_9BASI|nr:hypothetical protein CROQUDRAFT_99656 [Cronartium quercuum f. sp. fusiforme G11]
MACDDMDAHINKLHGYSEWLNAIVTPDNPLTPDDIHAMLLLNSLPAEWLPCVSMLMNES